MYSQSALFSLVVAWQRILIISSASVVLQLLSQPTCDSFRVIHGRNSFAFSSDSQLKSKTKSKLCYNRRSIDQSVLVSGPHLGPKTRFFFTVRQFQVC
jgi:hypothetical protein